MINKVALAGATVSTLTVKLVAALVLPAASRTVTLNGCDPSLNAAVVKLHAPLLPATTEPSTVVPSEIITMLPAVALPLSVGVLSSVAAPLVSAPCVAPTLSETTRSVTGVGAAVVTVKLIAAFGLTLPARSVAVTFRVCRPSASVGDVKLHAPLLPAVTEPITSVPSRITTTLPASAVPLSAGVLSLVLPPAAMVTGELPLLLAAVKPLTAVGTTVSTVTVAVLDAALVLPAASVTRTVSEWLPSPSTGEIKLHAPPVPAATEPSKVVPS